MPYRYPIYRANDANLRKQIMLALESLHERLQAFYLEYWPLVKKSVGLGETLTIPTGYQLLVYNEFTVTGDVNLDGELVIL